MIKSIAYCEMGEKLCMKEGGERPLGFGGPGQGCLGGPLLKSAPDN
jgi:hypothetical protein